MADPSGAVSVHAQLDSTADMIDLPHSHFGGQFKYFHAELIRADIYCCKGCVLHTSSPLYDTFLFILLSIPGNG